MIALRPSAASFTLPALIALAGSMIYALLMITTRTLRETDDTVLMTTQFLGVLAFGARDRAVRLGHAGRATTSCSWPASASPRSLSLFCVVRSLKLAAASVVVPYQYTLIVWSVLFGWQMFGELPDAYTIVGAAIIVAAGLYIFWREQVQAREARRSRWSCHDGASATRSAALAGIGLMSLGVFLFSSTTRSANGWSRPIRSGSSC